METELWIISGYQCSLAIRVATVIDVVPFLLYRLISFIVFTIGLALNMAELLSWKKPPLVRDEADASLHLQLMCRGDLHSAESVLKRVARPRKTPAQ